ncbi:response regulator [Shumkonia mesophila]|uniref:response regulator n=1 Tax=Shumkonia mesophila TaxID=2838854 RepID=UPI0029346806|nr:response regulator [Shumkonia mesophila]
MARVLVIDDEELARFTMREILEAAGHAVEEAKNGAQGISLQRSQQFDIVITDIIMPEKEGVQTIIELQRDFPTLPIVAISGGGRTRNLDFLKLAQQYGARKILPKPFSEEDLLNAVEDCLTSA